MTPFRLAVLLLITAMATGQEWLLPVRAGDRKSWQDVRLTDIGRYGLRRRERPGIPGHLHTGVDFKRPGGNYRDEPVFPAGPGVLVSLRTDGPFAQAIVEHRLDSVRYIWTVYEHIAGILVALHDSVGPRRPLARFMDRTELDRYGWQFDHLHFEVMRIKPNPANGDRRRPARKYQTYGLSCHTAAELDSCYFDPREFLEGQWRGPRGQGECRSR